MTPDQQREWNRQIDNINEMLDNNPKALSDMLKSGNCPMPIELLLDIPLGMFHCELCGTMVIAGTPHGPIDPEWHPEVNLMAKYFYEDNPEVDFYES